MIKIIPNDVTLEDLERAYDLIRQCIDYCIERDKIKFISSELAPNTYKGMRQYRDDFGQFLVYSGGDHGMLGEEYNIKFRALHDAMHYENELSFSFKDERVLSEMTSREFFNIAYNLLGATIWESRVVYSVIEAEIKGQIDYYEKYRSYVPNQTEYILTYFNLA